MEHATAICLANIDVMLAVVTDWNDHLFDLDYQGNAPGASTCIDPATLLGRLPHFTAQGVAFTHDGRLCMQANDGQLLDHDATLDRLFGTVGGMPASKVLFQGYGEGMLDLVLIDRCKSPPTSKKLMLARLHWARAVLTGEPHAHAPGEPAPALIAVLRGASAPVTHAFALS